MLSKFRVSVGAIKKEYPSQGHRERRRIGEDRREMTPCSWTRTPQQAEVVQCNLGSLKIWEYPVQRGMHTEVGGLLWRMAYDGVKH